MKKLFMFLLVFLLSKEVIYSQDLDLDLADETTASSIESGNLLIEITGTPFEGSSLLDFGEFRIKYVVADAITVRLGMYMDLNNEQLRPDYVTNFSTWRVTPGVEFQVSNNGGFRSYVALDVIIGQKIASLQTTTGSSVTGTTQLPSGSNATLQYGQRAYFQTGAALSAGAEYHFASRFYFGVEMGFQLNRTMYDDVHVDGVLYQDGVTNSTGDLLTTNSFKIGFKLL
ncbi:MAG: hypothetical protein OCD76_15975 [Reichenbachiella sp.]